MTVNLCLKREIPQKLCVVWEQGQLWLVLAGHSLSKESHVWGGSERTGLLAKSFQVGPKSTSYISPLHPWVHLRLSSPCLRIDLVPPLKKKEMHHSSAPPPSIISSQQGQVIYFGQICEGFNLEARQEMPHWWHSARKCSFLPAEYLQHVSKPLTVTQHSSLNCKEGRCGGRGWFAFKIGSTQAPRTTIMSFKDGFKASWWMSSSPCPLKPLSSLSLLWIQRLLSFPDHV